MQCPQIVKTCKYLKTPKLSIRKELAENKDKVFK